MEIQEIHLRYGRLIPLDKPPYPPQGFEEEKEESVHKSSAPPSLERLIHSNQHTPEETELLGKLKNMCVKIQLLQAINDFPIYNKIFKEKLFKHSGRRKKSAPTIKFISQFSNLMLGRVIFPKHLDHRITIVDVHIHGIIVPRTLIDLWAAINVMTKETILKLNLEGSLRITTMIS